MIHLQRRSTRHMEGSLRIIWKGALCIVVLTIDHFNSFVHGWRVGSFFCSKKGHQARFWLIALYLHNASGFCDESGRLGMRGIGDGGIRG